MKLKDFLTLKVGAGVLVSGTRYNPLINYDWSTTAAKEYKTDGVELVVNGGFDTDSGWIKEGPWTIVDGMAIAKGFTRQYQSLRQPYQFEIGSTYQIVIECTRWGANYVYIRKPRNSPVDDINVRINGVGTYTYYVTVASDSDEFALANASISSDMDISSISIQKVIQDPNKIYSKNLGTSSTPLSLYFGRGAYLNDVDQTITVPINTTIQTALKRVNGVVTISETSQTLTNYVIRGLDVHKDYYLFTRLLTTAEKDSYTNTPEAFYAMAQDDSTCVLNMPMCETDKYVRNMKSYSLGTNLADINLSSTITGTGNTIVQDVNVFNISSVTASNAIYRPIIVFSPNTFTSDLYNIEVEVKCTSGTLKVARLECTSSLSPNDILTSGTTKTYSLVAGFENVGGRRGDIYLDGLNYPIYTAVVTVKRVEKITAGIYPITNYTSSVRDNAKNLQYGLQTCKFVRDSLGVIQSASDYLECDGVGYGNTGWNSVASEEKTIEYIVEELLINSTNFENIVVDGKAGTNLYSRFNSNRTNSIGTNINLNGYTEVNFKNVVHITIVLKTNGYELFKDGVSQGFKNATGSISGLTDVIIGTDTRRTGTLSSPIRLFKVHSKALTQAEITKNYNSYVAKGLLT